MGLSETEIRKRLDASIAAFSEHDEHLLRVRASERSMCHKLAEYLGQQFQGWHIDCEYNRNGSLTKKLPSIQFDKDRSVYPDIIIHHRGTRENLLVIEAKCSDSSDDRIREDREKLELYRTELGYSYAVFLTFEVSKDFGISYEMNGSYPCA